MQFAQFARPLSLIVLAVILTACNLSATPAPTQDVGAIQTQVVEQVHTQIAMQRTQTAMAVSPTSLPSFTPAVSSTPGGFATFTFTTGTPFVFNTPSGLTPLASAAPTQIVDPCLQSGFISDVTIPDGTVMRPGEHFMKSWEIQNTGNCTWDDGFKLKYLGGDLGGHDILIDQTLEFVKPGQIQEYKIDLTAPLVEREYTDCWKMQDDGGNFFGTYLCVVIVVRI